MYSYTGIIYPWAFRYVKIAVAQTVFSAKKVYAKLEQWINGLLLPWGLWMFHHADIFLPPNNYSFLPVCTTNKTLIPSLEQWFWRHVSFKAILAPGTFSAYSFSPFHWRANLRYSSIFFSGAKNRGQFNCPFTEGYAVRPFLIWIWPAIDDKCLFFSEECGLRILLCKLFFFL